MRRTIIPYDPRLKKVAKRLRNNATLAERVLWQQLKSRQIRNCDFHRQKPLDMYIVDFYCHELNLAIEVDGITHVDKEAEDRDRQRRLESLGVSFLRFLDSDVRTNTDGVVGAIEEWIDRRTED